VTNICELLSSLHDQGSDVALMMDASEASEIGSGADHTLNGGGLPGMHSVCPVTLLRSVRHINEEARRLTL